MKAESPGEALQSMIAEAEREGLALNTRDQKLVL